MLTRREFGHAVAGSLAAASVAWSQTKLPKDSSRFGGVHIGAITYCYRSLRDASQPWSREGVDQLMDKTVNAYVQNRIDLAEFWIAFVEPPGGPSRGPTDPVARENLRKWRVARPLDVFERARKKFEDAGIQIYSCMANLSDDLTDDEIEAAFDFARTLKTNIISANCTKASIKRAAPFADRHKVYVSAHSENAPFDRNPDGMAYERNLVEALSYSPYIKVTLDTGHFTAFGGDAVKFVREHHDRMANLHLKDRLRRAEDRNDANTPEWGKGDAPIKEVLQVMKQRKSSFPACIEYEYNGKGTAVQEVQKCLDYARAALET